MVCKRCKKEVKDILKACPECGLYSGPNKDQLVIAELNETIKDVHVINVRLTKELENLKGRIVDQAKLRAENETLKLYVEKMKQEAKDNERQESKTAEVDSGPSS